MTYILHLFDTMQRRLEPIIPSDGKTMRIYTCGPTIYDFAHIGNFRTFLFEDLLRRTFQLFKVPVYQVMNITDVDDKTIKRATELGCSLQEATSRFKDAFFQDLQTLRIQPAEAYPEATSYIPQIIKMIQELEKKEAAYRDINGNVYFSLSKAPAYGKLSHLPLESLQKGASGRIHTDDYSEEGIADFVLWKAYDPQRDGSIFWESPWGRGRPGWHIECSVMAQDLLGDTIDLHAGGVDLIFPHHENEIAQSETATQKPFALHWVHAEHLLVDQKKMSKRLGNFYTFRYLLKKKIAPTTIRFFLLSTHYRTQLNFTFESLEGARISIKRIRDFAERVSTAQGTPSQEYKQTIDLSRDRFCQALSHDLNINEALAALFETIRLGNALLDQEKLSDGDRAYTYRFLKEMDSILDILTPEETSLPEEISLLVQQREEARQEKNWQKSDQLRKEITSHGYLIEDTKTGQKITKR